METLLNLPQNTLLDIIGLLDAMPDGARAALSALLLVAFLRLFERRIPGNEIQYGQSFRKSALAALIVIPAFVYGVPASRMTVFVEELQPAGSHLHPAWVWILAIWLAGAAASLLALLRSEIAARREAGTLPAIDDGKLEARLAHWCRRLGTERDIALVETAGTAPRFFACGDRVALPAAARHWPGNLQDVLLITALAHLKRHHQRWYLIGGIMNALYWPIPWVQTLTSHLILDFQRAADALAESCYRDRLGYDRALRQLAARLAPAGSGARQENPDPSARPVRMIGRLQHYVRALTALLNPRAEPDWPLGQLLEARSTEDKLTWTDPYDKVVLFVGQAVFFAFLLTGATLKERPPEVDYEYSLPFELFWKENFHRNLELQEKVQPMPGS